MTMKRSPQDPSIPAGPTGDASSPPPPEPPRDDQPTRLTFRVGVIGAAIAPAIFLLGVVVFFVIFGVFDMNALTASGMLGLLVAALFASNYSQFWRTVLAGVAAPNAVTLLVILMSIGMVAALISQTDVSGGFVWLADQLGIGGGVFAVLAFVMVCIISMATGSSLGSMFTAFPIFYPAGVALGADPALVAGAILSGALFGDSLAPISDSTIISASTQRYRRKTGTAEIGGVVRSRARYALTAAGISGFLFLVIGLVRSTPVAETTVAAAPGGPLSLIMVLPVAALLVIAVWKRDIFLAGTVGLFVGIVTGLATGLLAPSDLVTVTEDGAAGGLLVTGIASMLPLVGFSIVIFGMIGMLEAAGVFDRVVELAGRSGDATSPLRAELTIGIGDAVTSVVFAGVNSAAMLMFGPVADRIGAKAQLHPFRRSNVMDCFTMGIGAVVPVASIFLLLSSQLTQGIGADVPGLTALAIFPVAFYPFALTVAILFSVFTGWGRRFEGADGAELRKAPAVA